MALAVSNTNSQCYCFLIKFRSIKYQRRIFDCGIKNMWPNSILILRNNQENQPLIPRRNPREVDRPCCDPICWLYYTFIFILVLLLFIYGWSPSTAKLESEGMYIFFCFLYYSFQHTAWNTPSVSNLGLLLKPLQLKVS